jgi:hypothetical protein
VGELMAAADPLAAIMERANRGTLRIAQVDENGVVRQISHVRGPHASHPDRLSPHSPGHEVVEIDETTFELIREDTNADAPRGFLFDRAARRFTKRGVWAPAGMPATTLMARAEVVRLTAPASITLTWSDLPGLKVKLNEVDETVDSPLAIDMTAPGQYELVIVDPRVAFDFYRFVVTKGGPA